MVYLLLLIASLSVMGECRYLPGYYNNLNEQAHHNAKLQESSDGPQLAYVLKQGLEWQPTTGKDFPPGIVEGGYRAGDQPMYVGRTLENGQFIVGKGVSWSGVRFCNYETDKVDSSMEWDALVQKDSTTSAWVQAIDLDSVNNAVVGDSKAQYFVCRAIQGGELVPGNLDSKTKICSIATGTYCYHKEYPDYEVLTAIEA